MDVSIHPPQDNDKTFSIEYFTVSPLWITKGQEANLSWSVVGAINVTIDNGIGNVSFSDYIIVSTQQTTTYQLTASNGSQTFTSTVTLYVKIKENESQNSEIPDQEAIELTSQLEALLSNVPTREGYECHLYMDTTFFKLGEPFSSVAINESFQIPHGMNRIVCHLSGYYRKENITSFSGSKWVAKGLFAAGPGNLAFWNAHTSGEYYYYLGIYDCEDIENSLGVPCDESSIQDILLNVQPLVYDRILIIVSNEMVDCVNASDSDLCWLHLAEVTYNCTYCENIESAFWKEHCLEEC